MKNKSIKLAAIAAMISVSVFTGCSRQGEENKSTEESVTELTASELHLSDSQLNMKIKDTKILEAKVTPDKVDVSGMQWKSNDANVAAVDKNGKVTAAAEGTAVITAMLDGIEASCTIVVEPDEPELSWMVEPVFEYENIQPLIDKFPLDIQGLKKVQVYGCKGRAFYYENGSAGLIDYSGNVIMQSSAGLKLDARNGIVDGVKSYNADGTVLSTNYGGGVIWFGWDETAGKIVGGSETIQEGNGWSNEYMTAMDSVSVGTQDMYGEGGITNLGTKRLVNTDGTLVVDEKFEDIKSDDSFYKNIVGKYAVVKKDGRWGYLSADGNYLTECIYDDAYPFHNGIAAVKKDGKAGYILEDGSEAAAFIFDETRSVYRGKAWVKKDGKWGVLDIEKLTGIKSAANPAVGLWSLRDIYGKDGTKIAPRDAYGSAIEMGSGFEFYEDGTCEFSIGFEYGSGTYSVEGNTIHIVFGKTDNTCFRAGDTTDVVIEDEDHIVFTNDFVNHLERQ